jgi:hypothetical protein
MAETRFGIRVVLLGVAVVFAGLVAISAEAVERARLVTSVDAATKLNSAPITDQSVVSIRIDGSGIRVTSALDEILPDGVDVDALSILDDGRVVFSTDVSFEIDGFAADDEDLVLNDRGVLSVVFDGSAAGLPASADIDAVHVVSLAPLEILYSLDAPAEVDGVVFADDDIIRFDGANHTVVRSGASLIGDEMVRADVDALWYDPSRNEFILSLDVSIAAATGRTAADAGDLVLWANGALLMYFDASVAGLSATGLDLDAVSFEFAFFADDFETGNTTMWSNTTP